MSTNSRCLENWINTEFETLGNYYARLSSVPSMKQKLNSFFKSFKFYNV